MGPALAIVVFVALQWLVRERFLRRAIEGKVSRRSASLAMGISIGSLPLLGSAVGGAPWGIWIVALTTVVLFLSGALGARLFIDAAHPVQNGDR
jgi:hypothetical protein